VSDELYYAEMEATRNQSIDAYFECRPQLLRTIEQETIFKAGFERAFAMMWARLQALETSAQKEVAK